ncbi:oxidoreductase [Rhodophyticola sp. CCM32]|uniref:NAD(P)/FAD-dependent oxidoreductase n=1 Tax=Rhodophyticola sp. CCM32 TaxID=2916397 RepID=UPI00107F8EEB|nr:FAD-dependent oxidoreductase [Rhodophyticola sp. CCM32]QBY00322.1 oxidoreductase [Rhodophyticola sp. CCM32]
MAEIVVIGAGQAGSSAVFKLRALGHTGRITLIGDEAFPPYQRPPLSKAYLLGDMTRERLFLMPEPSYQEHDIRLKLGAPVTAINPDTKVVSVGDETIKYDELLLATGSSPIQLPAAIGGELGGVYSIRTLADIDAMASEFSEGRNVLIVGGGYIGLEAAAVASSKGLKVTVVEMADRILQRVAAPETSDYFRTLHQNHGVDIREGIGLSRLSGTERVTHAELSDGQVLDVDFVLVGIGIRPNTDIAGTAGVAVQNGIETNTFGQTTVPNIWAAGDCASFPFAGQMIRLESVPNAIDQAEIVAGNILGAKTEYIAKPWFWSDQYDVKLQIAGLNTGYDNVVARPSDRPGSVSHWYYGGDTLLAVDAMNAPREFMIGRRLIEAGKSPIATAVGDLSTDLKSLM